MWKHSVLFGLELFEEGNFIKCYVLLIHMDVQCSICH